MIPTTEFCLTKSENADLLQSVDGGAALAPTILLIGVVICMGFIVQAERRRGRLT